MSRDPKASPKLPPKPPARPDRVSLWRYLRLFRRDILSAQPARLYRAWMAEFRTPFFRSYMINDPDLLRLVLRERPVDFPKSNRIRAGLEPLLGRSVFVTNGAEWERQRRIIDPAFEGAGRLEAVFPQMRAAGLAAVSRLAERAGDGPVEIEAHATHAAADVIFRTLFSIPITDETAAEVFRQFRAHQRAQPLLNLAAFLPLPRWVPRFHRARTRRTARAIRGLIADLVAARARLIEAGSAPDDLATRIMTTPDPVTGKPFSAGEMIDQVAIFFLAGHETSASALAWALWLVALFPEWQERLRAEARDVLGAGDDFTFSQASRLRLARDVFRETLRLYPPVPMMVRENACPENFRKRAIAPGSQIVISPWHLHRHERLWERPDEFDPGRYASESARASLRAAYLPFSAGPRVCPGAGFAMLEGPLLLALMLRELRFETVPEFPAIPVANLTVRAKHGLWLKITLRQPHQEGLR